MGATGGGERQLATNQFFYCYALGATSEDGTQVTFHSVDSVRSNGCVEVPTHLPGRWPKTRAPSLSVDTMRLSAMEAGGVSHSRIGEAGPTEYRSIAARLHSPTGLSS